MKRTNVMMVFLLMAVLLIAPVIIAETANEATEAAGQLSELLPKAPIEDPGGSSNVWDILSWVLLGIGGTAIGFLLKFIKDKRALQMAGKIGELLDIPAEFLKAIQDGDYSEKEKRALEKEIAEAKAAWVTGDTKTFTKAVNKLKSKASVMPNVKHR